ncbi:uncharacterized protein LOC110457925 [Mizuhopecten yessoensis]|uniref:uncharacterized protein LOC110457925 n=1 Tax=Mizuhopecten yessoensis TaxID=6573 RepID=UPI000B45E472|nr:uncharacterized protein LOC110457925 [Mizuhopecten yessoensis]
MDASKASDTDLSEKIREAVVNSQHQVLSHLDSLITTKLEAFETRMCNKSDEQISLLNNNLAAADTHKFAKKSCEDQFKFNSKVKAKLMEAERATQLGPGAAVAKITEGISFIDYRQKLVKLADTSEAGWRAVDEYVANPIASDSDDEKRMERATSKASRKLKAGKAKSGKGGRGRHAPYSRRWNGPMTSTEAVSNPDDRAPWRAQRPGLCHRCGKPGHWRLECPGVSGGAVLNGNKLSKMYLDKHVQSDSSVHDIEVIMPLSGTGKSYDDDMAFVHDKMSDNHDIFDKVDAGKSPVGRLKTRISYWREKGACDAVLTIVSEGYKIPFREVPTCVKLTNNKSARDDPEFVGVEIGKLVKLGCVTEVTTPPHVVNPLTVAYNRKGLGLEATLNDAIQASGVEPGSSLYACSEGLAARLLCSKSDNTNKKYHSSFCRWQTFISPHGFSALPASPIHVVLYLNHLLGSGVSYSVVAAGVYAIKWAHSLHGFPDPTSNSFVQNLMEASKRHAKKPVCKKEPVTIDNLKSLCDIFGGSGDLLVIRDLAMILLCFAGFLRFNELINLRCVDVKMFDDYLTLIIRKSKTDQYHHGNEVVISKGYSSACPFAMLTRYLASANISLDSEHFLFKQVYRSGKVCALIHKAKPLSYTCVREAILKRLKRVTDGNIGLHSLRSGGATAAANSGVNERCFKRHGRWKSDSSRDGYVKDSLENRLSVTQKLGL